MDKIWLQSYAPGVPETIDANAHTSLTEIFEQSVAKFGNKPAYSNFGNTLSFEEVDTLSRNFAAYLTQTLGLKKGDRLAIMMPNTLQYPITLFAALRAGLVVVNVNPLYTPRELEYQLIDSGAVAIVVLENFAATVATVFNKTPLKHVITTQIGDLFPFPKSMLTNVVVKYVKKMVPSFSLPSAIHLKDALSQGRHLPFNRVKQSLDDTAFLQYTGGTTGVSKGAILTHRNMVSNLLQAYHWAKSAVTEGEDVCVTALPLYHIFALTANAFFSLKIGAKCLLITNPRDFPAFVKTLSQENFSLFVGINTLFNALLHTPGFDKLDFSALKLTLGGGMAVQRSVAEQWKAVTGCTLIEAYGLTETSPAVCINPMDIPDYTGAIGLPVSSTEVSIRAEDGSEVPLGEAGELWVKGPQVMPGYWMHDEDTGKALTDDGWLHTGDVAKMDEKGYVFIVDRLKDMILISGFNVYPNEIESVLAAHPKILEAGVIGVSDTHMGEAVKAIIVKDDPSLTEEEVRAHCRENLTNYKRPKHIEFIDALPKTNVGKILRRELRDQHGGINE
ncbi:MAG: long-chain-fatty-acid--CoA ligase [Zetaproteobacteria bacterium CG2_30_46_52]|nr:MAG: long-chain-fatty-acid--CoA ligase [Zetaproteobacteria bacterium CG2_30_46_52]